VIDGTANLTTTTKAPVFVSKGHFYQISDLVSSSVPLIVDQQDQVILPSEQADDTYLGIERITGVNVQAYENIQNNFQVFNDALFSITDNDEYGMFVPLVLVRRVSQFTQEQADAVFGDLVLGIKVKWGLFGLLLGLGCVCKGLMIYYCKRRKTIKL